MRCWPIALLAFCTTALAQDSIPSPNGRFAAYTATNPMHGIGKQLLVRSAQSRATGRLLLANDRSREAQWSPDSRFLAVTNHTDPHISVVLVFGIHGSPKAAPDAELLFVSPDPGTFDTKWVVSGWDTPHRAILLEKHVAGVDAQPMRFSIGTKPLQLP